MDNAVSVRGMRKVYEGRVRALDGVDLDVERGKVFALLGPNGAGKTTLMRILTTQIRPTSGEATISGLDAVREGGKVRKEISYIPQEMSVWTDISGYENLLVYSKMYGIGRDQRKGVISGALRTMGMEGYAHRLVNTYSGGMVRRLEIACALLTRPKVLFLDEPTIGLDPSARKAVWERLLEFKKEFGTTIFFNTHYMEEAEQHSDRVAIINGGKIVVSGTVEELKRSVGREAITVELGGRAGRDVLTKVRKLPFVGGVEARGSELRISVKDADSALPGVMKALEKAGARIRSASIAKPTLDDVFLKYAGARLDTEGRISDARQTRESIRR